MDVLGDYLWLQILDYVDLSTILELEIVSRDMRRIVCKYWRTNKVLHLHNYLHDRNGGRPFVTKYQNMLNIIHKAGVSLQEVYISNNVHLLVKLTVTTSLMAKIAEGCPNLCCLFISGCTFSTNFDFNCLLNLPSHSLVRFEIINCMILADGGNNSMSSISDVFHSILSKFRNLEIFSLRGTKFGGENMALHCDSQKWEPNTNLLRLEFNAVNLTSLEFLANLSHLRTLTVSNSTIVSQDLQTIVAHCDKIESLDLGHCRHVSTFRCLAHLSNLKYLILDNNSPNLSDECLSSICESCTALQQLSLAKCGHLTNVALRNIRSLSHLRALDIAGTDVDYWSLSLIMKSCPQLTYVNVFLCLKLEYEAVGFDNRLQPPNLLLRC